ncbi:MAG: ABC transporter substrate-binding protein [Dehalococcoidales bacterium]
MKRRFIWVILTCLIVTSLVLASCSSSTTTSTQTTVTATTSTATSTTTAIIPTSTTSSASTITATTTSTGNWWDSLGTPQYGGAINIAVSGNITGFDPNNTLGQYCVYSGWIEDLFADQWTLSPSVYAYQSSFLPNAYVGGWLAQSWEFTNPSTFVVHLRQGVYWQNISPANGRELVANDVIVNINREFGWGGFTKNPAISLGTGTYLTSVSAPDNFTVDFNWSITGVESIYEWMFSNGGVAIADPEAITAYGNLNNWHNAIGTGPFLLTDFVDSGSATLTKNPNYWGYDERYPQNQLPYANKVNVLVIPNQPTALAAMRAGKIDVTDGLNIQAAIAMKQSNPEIGQVSYPGTSCQTMDMVVTLSPFSDIRVRQALQQAINLPDIAANYYLGTTVSVPSDMTSVYLTGYGWPYSQWPASLQAEYAFNPTNAKALLAAAGYPNGFTTSCVVDTSSDLNLFAIVQSDFSAIGVNMNVNALPSAAWTAYVQTNRSATGLIWRNGGSLGLNYQFLRQFTRYQTGYTTNWLNVSNPALDALYTQAVNATSMDQIQQLLVTLNQIVAQNQWAVSLLPIVSYGVYQPWLKGYNGQFFAISGGASGPYFLGFFASRFWIDQNVKN